MTTLPEADDAEELCVVCQCDTRPDDGLWQGPCSHTLHRECAEAYVREWRLNHVNNEPVPCPVCKSTDSFELDQFPVEQPDEEAAEQRRRADAVLLEQEEADRQLARDLFYDEFGEFTVRRRATLRRRDLEALISINARVWETS